MSDTTKPIEPTSDEAVRISDLIEDLFTIARDRFGELSKEERDDLIKRRNRCHDRLNGVHVPEGEEWP